MTYLLLLLRPLVEPRHILAGEPPRRRRLPLVVVAAVPAAGGRAHVTHRRVEAALALQQRRLRQRLSAEIPEGEDVPRVVVGHLAARAESRQGGVLEVVAPLPGVERLAAAVAVPAVGAVTVTLKLE